MKRNLFLTFIATFGLLLGLGITLTGDPLQLNAQEPEAKLSANVSTAFTYQGRLTDGGSFANGVYDFQFKLYNAETGGAQVGSLVAGDDIAVSGGLFNATLDFGDVFNGDALWLEISVRSGNESGSYTALSPRQSLTPTPYALRARLADNSLGTLSCAANQIAKFDGAAWVCATDQSAALEARVAALEDLLVHLSRTDNDIYITGANLHVVNGLTDTATINGLGNVIIGYNEERAFDINDRSGSHTLVVGNGNNYSSYGGMVVGLRNTISGTYASVSGGSGNTASGSRSSVSGGARNTASGLQSSVSGGSDNTTSVQDASVSGGASNTASGSRSSVSGGGNNIASGIRSSVSGGNGNTASVQDASVSGGNGNTASGIWSSVSGGRGNTASGENASVSGGGDNIASGIRSSVSGGDSNVANNEYASVSGGFGNTASGFRSSVSGGGGNTASGSKSSVSGGSNRESSSTFDWRAGGLFENQ